MPSVFSSTLLCGLCVLSAQSDKAEALSEAARKGDAVAVKKLLDDGVDVNTTADGTFTWAFSGHCSFVSESQAVCSGVWHITGATGAYAGAQGEGTLSDVLTFDALGNATGDDTFTGRIQIT